MKKIYILILSFFLVATITNAQIGAYSFANSTSPFATIVGGTGTTAVTISSMDDGISAAQTIPFTFIFGGNNFTTFKINSNGWLNIDASSTSTTNYSALNGSDNNVISGFNRDLNGTLTTATSYYVQTVGTTPNQITKIEWVGIKSYSGSVNPATGNFQIWLYQGSNVVEIHYGGFTSSSGRTTAATCQVGLRGVSTSAADVKSLTNVGTWASPTQSSSSTATCAMGTFAAPLLPDNGRTYTFTPPSGCTGTPNAGSISGASSSCLGSTVTLTNSGGTVASGIGYQWEQSTDNGVTWGNATGGSGNTTSIYTTPALTGNIQYRLKVTCTNSTLSATTSAFLISINNPVYAVLPYTEDFESWISACYMSDVPTNNWRNSPITGNNSWRRDDQGPTAVWSGPTGGIYAPVFTTGAHSARFHAYYAASASVGNLDNYVDCSTGTGSWQLSFDFILNASSTASLGVFVSTDGGTTFTQQGTNLTNSTTWTNKSFIITSTSATTVIRLKATSDFGSYDIGIDNYKLALPPACLPPSAPVATVTSTTTASLSWTAPGTIPANGYEWVVQTSATAPTGAGTAAPATTASATGLIANTTYYLFVRSNCGGSFSPWVSSVSFYTGYCIISGTSATSFINSFTTTGGSTNINNTASGYSTGGYGDFTAQVVTQQQGAVVSITGSLYTPSDDGLAIWVDWNDNLVFEAGEQVYNSAAYLAAFPAISFTVPATATIGNHRMRVVLDYNATSPSPCSFVAGRGEAEDYTINVTAGTPCTGSPAGVAVTPISAVGCSSGSATFTASTTSTGTGITYQWQSSPAGANTWTNISGATSTTYTTPTVTTSTDYQCVLTCSNTAMSGTSNTATLAITGAPANDEACGAITLVLDGASDCGNTTCATSVADPVFSNSTPNNTVWYKYTPTVTGSVIITMARPTGVTTGLLNGWVAMYTATGTCPAALTFTELTPALAAFNLPTTPTVSATTPALTAGTTYYFMIDGVSGAFGAYCISIQTPPPPPNCTTNIAPADMATNVTLSPNIAFSWNAAATATSYDVYFGTINPPTTLLGNFAVTSITVTGGSANTLYYWYVVPKNAGGAAVGCVSNVTSFTTTNICTPSTTNGGTSSDALVDFVLNGEGSTAISVLGAAPIASPGYIDLTGSTTVDLAAGKAYVGNFKVQSSLDNLTIWIDYNNNNSFEASEMVLNNLTPIGATTTSPYSILISPTASVGAHKMRVRDIFNAAGPVDPCGGYTYGEGKDFTVNIVAAGSGTPYAVSNLSSGACVTMAKTTIDAPSNNTSVNVPILDASGGLVAQLNANGNTLNTISASYYHNTGAVRQDATGQKYLDRNITITPNTQPSTGTVAVRYYFTAAELAALQAADPTVTGVSVLNCSKSQQACSAAAAGANTFLAQQASGLFGADYYVDLATPSFSSFYLKSGLGALPVAIEYLNGTKQGATNLLDWKVTCTTSPTVSISLERSGDGRNFRSINDQTATAVRCQQVFNYTDAAPLAGANYYRLKITTVSGEFKYSSIVVLLNKDKGFELISIAPNPVKDNAILTLSSAKAGKIDISITDVNGKLVAKQSVIVVAGNNPIALKMSSLGAGTYNISATNIDGENKNTRFVKY